MDAVQLAQGSRATPRQLFTCYYYSTGVSGTHLTDLKWSKTKSTLEPPSGFEQGTPGLGIQHLHH